ncbi:MAG: FAD binding domain-containing protein, partial [Thauera sp.]
MAAARRPGGRRTRARALAGGTDLIPQLREGRRQARLVADLKHIPALTALTRTAGGGWRIGAAASIRSLGANAEFAAEHASLLASARLIGSLQVQSRASLGGNLCNAAPSADAVPLLLADKTNPVVALCLASSYAALGNIDETQKILKDRETDAPQALAWLRALDVVSDGDRLATDLPKINPLLSEADRKYFDGRVRELRHETESAIACYDDVLSLDPNHKQALFRLAVNVDLRGEDEEARELYERALMAPPVNVACVVNLGILYEDMGNYRRAMQCFDLALQANPENTRARLYRRDAAAALNMYYDEDQERRDDKRNKLLRTPINDFELSVRSRNCLSKMN